MYLCLYRMRAKPGHCLSQTSKREADYEKKHDYTQAFHGEKLITTQRQNMDDSFKKNYILPGE